jgi:hypothetical protein
MDVCSAIFFFQIFFPLITMSLYDASISETVWNGKIPLKVTLDPTDIDIYGNEKVYDPIYVRFVLQIKTKRQAF